MHKNTKQSHGGIHTPLMACYHAAHSYPGGLPVVAVLMEKSRDVLRKKLDSKTESHVLTLPEAMHILRITGDTRILDAINAEAGAAWFFPDEVPAAPSDMDVLKSSTQLMDRTMALINEFQGALEDGDVNADERARLDQCRMELFQQIKHYDHTAKQFESEGKS